MFKIRRSRDRLIYNMGLPIPEKDGLYIEIGPRLFDAWHQPISLFGAAVWNVVFLMESMKVVFILVLILWHENTIKVYCRLMVCLFCIISSKTLSIFRAPHGAGLLQTFFINFSVHDEDRFTAISVRSFDVHIWQVSQQLSCGDTCQIWTWHKLYK